MLDQSTELKSLGADFAFGFVQSMDGERDRSSQPAASLPDSKEHHPPRLSFRYRHTPINTTTKLSGAFQFNPKRPLHVSYLMCSQVNSQRSCSK